VNQNLTVMMSATLFRRNGERMAFLWFERGAAGSRLLFGCTQAALLLWLGDAILLTQSGAVSLIINPPAAAVTSRDELVAHAAPICEAFLGEQVAKRRRCTRVMSCPPGRSGAGGAPVRRVSCGSGRGRPGQGLGTTGERQPRHSARPCPEPLRCSLRSDGSLHRGRSPASPSFGGSVRRFSLAVPGNP
jgi:hypothetical protein